MTFTPTPEQLACIDAALNTSDNLRINALAGAAKTSTLKLIMNKMPSTPILYLVFNKKNSDEAKAEQAEGTIPSNVMIKTFNACGHGVWASNLGRKRLTLEADKLYKLLRNRVDNIKNKNDKQDAYDALGDTLKLIKSAKIAGYVPEGKYPTAKRLCTLQEFIDSQEVEPELFQLELLQDVLFASIQQAYDGTIDFDDQIYMPTLFGGTFPRFPLVMADEAQDLSPLNHAMLRRLVTKRLIIVGDPWQSIYGFRGAVSNGMDQLKSEFAMRDLTLSVSFRCPIAVIKKAQERVTHMRWPEWAKPGEVRHVSAWSEADIPEGAAIICRNNAPLFKLGLELIKRKRGIKLIGADIGPGLVRILKKLGDASLSRDETLAAIDRWEREQLLKSKKKGSVADRAACLRVFAEEGTSLGDAIIFAEHLFASGGTIQLLSGHKSKGLEWPVVFHLDPWRIPSCFAEHPEAIEQELNIRYVIETRAKETLILADLNKFGVPDASH